MKRSSRIVGGTASLLFVLAGVGIWNAAFRAPSTDRLPLPADLVSVESSAGKEMLDEKTFAADYESLTSNYESQARAGFCGVASAVVVLNALEKPESRITQSTFFDDATSNVRSSLQVTFGGMSLGQLGDLLRAHGAKVEIHYASDTGLEAFRTIARDNLKTPGDFLLVNYQRAILGQKEMGHISPVAAYNAATDRMLVLDVAAYKYPPVWVPTAMLWNAMKTEDTSSNRTRGFIVVRK